MYNFIERHFVWIIASFSTIALFEPTLFIWLKNFIPLLLGIIMFAMGFSLKTSEMKNTWNKKWVISIAIIVKYIVMPASAYIIGSIYNLSLPELIGMVIIGSCPGGTAANVMSYLSKANIALTIILTFGTTILAPLVTPTLIYLLLHKHISIPFWGIFNTMILILFLPIIAGMLLKSIFKKNMTSINKTLPMISIIAIALVVACVVALNHHKVISFPMHVILAVTTLNLVGYLIGILLAKLMQCKKQEQKSISFEYGVFDSGLGVVIASSFFGPVAALPGALISIIQNLTAPLLVKLYLYRDQSDLKHQQSNCELN